jgi:hypothetical protein
LTKYDLPAPLRASTTELWLSCAHRFHISTPAEVVFTPYSTASAPTVCPGAGPGRSAPASGKAAASASVSSTRVIPRPSTPSGSVVV